MAGAKKQAEDQRQYLHKAKEQLAIALEKIESQQKELERKELVVAQAKWVEYDVGVKETEENLKAQVTKVYRGYCLRVWTEALDPARVDAFSELRRPENVFYPPALRIATNLTTEVVTTLASLPTNQLAIATLPTTTRTTTTSSELANEGEVGPANPSLETIS